MGQHDKTTNVRERSVRSNRKTRDGSSGGFSTLTGGNLTRGEALLIHRRRTGLTQVEMAASLNVTRNTYGDMERDLVVKDINKRWMGDLTEPERCLIWRRRIGMTIPKIADEIGRSRYWVNLMEQGKVPHAELYEYWMKNGG